MEFSNRPLQTAIFFFVWFLSTLSFSEAQEIPAASSSPSTSSTICTLAVTVEHVISAATKDYLERAQAEAKKQNCNSILIRINTPGGELQATRLIVQRILSSPLPYLCLIEPGGGHAGSAGALILQACHVNGGVPATNLGAATPILSSGQMPEDLRKKMINDTVSWSQSLAQLRGRNLNFAKEIVTEAKALSSEEAVRIKALDIFADDEAAFLKQVPQFQFQLQDQKKQTVVPGPIREFSPDLRFRILEVTADPTFAYMLFMASLALIYFELTHSGFVAPGVIGAMGLILSLISFHKLEVRWGGLALIVMGLAFLVAEVFLPSFGVLGIGGVVALIFGSIFLVDPQVTGFSLPLSLILTVSLTLGAFVLGLGFLALRSLRTGKKDWEGALIGQQAVVVSLDGDSGGQVEVLGEIWRFEAQGSVRVGDKVEILSRRGLTLEVRKK